ncbi:MAG: OmpA family protein [Spirochaetales bacterium]
MNTILRFGALVLLVALGSCQSSAPPAPVVADVPVAIVAPIVEPVTTPVALPEPVALVQEPAQSRVEILTDGFSPKAQAPGNELFLSFRWGEPSQVSRWQLDFADAGGRVVRSLAGEKATPGVAWNGRDDAGQLVEQGSYHAVLSWTDLSGQVATAAPSSAFWVDIVPPSGTITVTPQPFRLVSANILVNPEFLVTIQLQVVSGGTGWATWRLGVLHPDGRLFRDFISEEHRQNTVVWDGRALNNAQLEAGTTYRLQAEVFSRYGNRGLLVGGLAIVGPEPVVVAETAPGTEAPPTVTEVVVITPEPSVQQHPLEVTVSLDGQLLAALPVWFAPNTADLEATSPELDALNHSSLSQLAALLMQSPGTAVTVVGHANQVLYYDAAKAAFEQSETLLPLSLARAETVRKALVGLGLSGAGMLTQGVGALEPLAPFDDPANRWKNRRVAIELATEGL